MTAADVPDLHQIASAPPSERVDAARNRGRVLDAARRLFAEHGVDGVTMDAVAQEAGVGKGTVFRRFGDKSGLVAALLDERERLIQQAILSGPAPLGPGVSGVGPGPAVAVASARAQARTRVKEATPAERRHAFVDAYLDYLVESLDLLRLLETVAPGARYRVGSYVFWHLHLAVLFREERVSDPEFRAHAVLALLDADLVHSLRSQGYSWERIRDGVQASISAH